MHSTGYTVMFAGAVCVVCSIFVSGSAVLLKPRQVANAQLDRQSKVLGVAGLATPGEKLSPADIRSRFESGIVPVVVDLKSGDVAPDADPKTFDQRKAQRDSETRQVLGDPSAQRPLTPLVVKLKPEPLKRMSASTLDPLLLNRIGVSAPVLEPPGK